MEGLVIYLNNAATSWPKPPKVIDSVEDSLKCPFGESARSTDSLTSDAVSEGRSAVAGFFHVPDPDHIIFTANAMDSLNILIAGFARQVRNHSIFSLPNWITTR